MALYNRTGELVERYFDKKPLIIIYNYGKVLWELVSSTFFDRDGNVFYDKNGVPFQGKLE